jgi:antirestriction protein ArdC
MMADLIARIEDGVPPWRAPWVANGDPGVPLRSDGQPFSGTNLWLLAFIGAVRGYTSPYWFTFKQALEIEAPVRKGEKGHRAILYKTRVVDGDDGDTDAGGEVRRYLKAYSVFNAEQLEGCPQQYLTGPPVDPELRRATRSRVLDAIPATIHLGGSKAAYFPTADYITLPPPEAFRSPDDFLATKAHELVHWTAHPSRLNRDLSGRHGDPSYAFEELVAEIGACALGLHLGLAPELRDDHAAYLAHWASILKERPAALLHASSLAQRAVDHLVAYSARTAEQIAA